MKEITEIKKIGRGDRYHIFLDGEYFGTFEAEILAKASVKTGHSYDEDFFEKLKIENGNYACFNRGLGLLEKTMKTEKMLKDYLRKKGYPKECIERATEKLKSYGYINDEVFAETFISSYKNVKSKRKLLYDLMSKGVDKELIEEKLNEMTNEEDEKEKCVILAEKYMKNKELDIKTKQKLFNHLAGKGFDYSSISYAWEKIESDRN